MKRSGCHRIERWALLKCGERKCLLWLTKDAHFGAASDKNAMTHLPHVSSLSQWSVDVTKGTHFTYSSVNLETTLLHFQSTVL